MRSALALAAGLLGLSACSLDWSSKPDDDPNAGDAGADGSPAGDGDPGDGEADGDVATDGSTDCEPGADACIDDACADDNGGCAQLCTSAGGSAQCSCEPGHALADDGKSCTPFVWSTPVLLELRDADGLTPKVVVDKQGRATAVWAAGFDGVWANRFEPGRGWLGAVALDESDQSARTPAVEVDAQGEVLALWEQTSGTQSVWATRFVEGVWERPAELDTGSTRPALALSEDGSGAAVWNRIGTDRGSLAGSRYVRGAGWSTPRIIDIAPSRLVYRPQVALGEGNAAHVVWSGRQDTQQSAFGNHDDGAGLWGSTANLETSADVVAEDDTMVASHPTGPTLAMWSQITSASVYTSWASSFTGGEGWSTPVLLADPEGASGAAEDLVVDASGTGFAVWGGVQVARYADGGFGESRKLDAGDGTSIAMDGAGNAVAAWTKDTDVWASRFDARSKSWSSPELVEHDNFGSADSVSVALDPQGHAFVVWLQRRDGHRNVWASRLEACAEEGGCAVTSPPVCTTDGTGDCSCPEGFRKGEANSCVDIDECQVNIDGCDDDPDACQNREGGFYCQCPPGRSGSGFGTEGCPPNEVLDPWS